MTPHTHLPHKHFTNISLVVSRYTYCVKLCVFWSDWSPNRADVTSRQGGLSLCSALLAAYFEDKDKKKTNAEKSVSRKVINYTTLKIIPRKVAKESFKFGYKHRFYKWFPNATDEFKKPLKIWFNVIKMLVFNHVIMVPFVIKMMSLFPK